jgi:hypothetical protein
MSHETSRNAVYRHMKKSEVIEQALETVLAADASAAAPAIEEKELVRRILQFANTGHPKDLPGVRTAEHGGQTFILVPPDAEKWQIELRKDLSAILKGKLTPRGLERLLERSRHVIVRTYELGREGPIAKDRHFVNDLPPLVADVLLRVLTKPELRNDVRQCQFPGCSRYFLASELAVDPRAPGRRPYRYCDQKHGRSPGALRTAKWRRAKSKNLATKPK